MMAKLDENKTSAVALNLFNRNAFELIFSNYDGSAAAALANLKEYAIQIDASNIICNCNVIDFPGSDNVVPVSAVAYLIANKTRFDMTLSFKSNDGSKTIGELKYHQVKLTYTDFFDHTFGPNPVLKEIKKMGLTLDSDIIIETINVSFEYEKRTWNDIEIN